MKFAIVHKSDAQNNRALLNASTSSDFTQVRTDDSGDYYFFSFIGNPPSVYNQYAIVDLAEAKQLLGLSSSEIAQRVSYRQESKVPAPFASKKLPDGQKLFRRKHGVSHAVEAGATHNFDITVPYAHAKITGAEIVGCEVGDVVDLTVHDSTAGDYTGVPSHQLNQFGFGVVMCSDIYYDSSQYDADLYGGMIVRIRYTNNGSSSKTVGVNLTLHEVVS